MCPCPCAFTAQHSVTRDIVTNSREDLTNRYHKKMFVYVWFSKHEIHHCKKLLWCLLVILLSLGGRRGMVFYYLWEPLKATFEFRRTTTISDSSKCSRRWKLNRFCTARFYNNCIIAPTTSWCYKLLICRTFKLNWIWQSNLANSCLNKWVKTSHYTLRKSHF